MTLAENSSPSAPAERPTGLKPVLDVIPDRCYERSTMRGLGLVVRDLVLYAAAIAGLAVTDRWYLLVPLWLLAGLAVSGLFALVLAGSAPWLLGRPGRLENAQELP